jgi:hypothetical protein
LLKTAGRLAAAAACTLVLCAPAARAQALPNQVLALYPPQTGEIAYLNIRALSGSPHYARLKAQVLPERFRQIAEWTQYIGIDFDREVYQLSWGFLPGSTEKDVALVGVAEGRFPLGELEQTLKQRKLSFARRGKFLLLPLGKNEAGQEFVFAFVDGSTAVYGFRGPVEEMLDRREQGGASLLNNQSLRSQVTPLNGNAPVWIAMDQRFTLLAVKQLLPGVVDLPGFETLAARLESATLRFDLADGLLGSAAVRCKDGSDAALVSALMQAALTYQTWRLSDTNPELAKALGALTLNRTNERVEMALAIKEADFLTLLNKNSFALKF